MYDPYIHRLPAAPLAAVVTRLLDREITAEDAGGQGEKFRDQAYERLGVSARNFHRWRTQPRATVQADTADTVLTRTPYLWFDVWPQCENRHKLNPDRECQQCVAYYRARRLFTGKKPPKGFR